MTNHDEVDGAATFGDWLETEKGRSAAPWQVKILAEQRFEGLPTTTTFDLLLDALNTVRPPKPR